MKKLVLIGLLTLAGSWMKAQITVTFSGITSSCNNDGTATANVSGGTAPYTINWTQYDPVLNNYVVVFTGQTITNSAGGYYYVTVTDANSALSQWNYVNIPTVVNAYISNVVNANCPNNDGSVTYAVSGGTAPYDYSWSNGQTFLAQGTSSTISNLAAGNYSVAVTDANGCIYSHSDSIATVYSQASFSVNTTSTNANCNDGTSTANITGTGAAPYTYYWNTTPPQTTATATGLDAYSYPTVMVTDANGCTAGAYAYIYYGPNALQVSGTSSPAVCPNNNGSVNINVSNGTPPYSYAWSTGATTQDITGVASGSYTLTVTDNAGCTITVNKYVGITSPINASVNTIATGCSNNTGSASVSVSGGTAPYAYLWNNGQTTSSITGLSTGWYGVQVTDANGCIDWTNYGYVSIPQSCFGIVSGYVYNDMDGNCALNGSETGLPWRIIDLGNGQYSSTNNNGYYSVSTLAPATYTISHMSNWANWTTTCPVAAYTVTSVNSTNTGGNDFYDVPVSLQNDVALYVYGGLARPGFSHDKYYSIYNNGTTTMSGTIEIVHDANETFLGSPNATAYNPTTRTITLAYTNLGAQQAQYGWLYFSLPSSVAIGTVLHTTGIAYPVTGDAVPADNYDTSDVTVVGSYDPNMKEVSPAGTGAAGLIPPTTDHFDYTVHFQNTGTYAAENIVVVDTLDADLDITTFQLLGASHPVSWEMSGPGIVTFTFNNINLPDMNSNEPASHGLVSYRIKPLANPAGGTAYRNTAYIYFDYNAPIVTNTTLNTVQIVGVKENIYNSGISISPNPAQDKITITNKTKEICRKVEIMDINGRLVASIIPASSGNTQLPEMAAGVYIVNAHFDSGIYKEKLVIGK
jgi:hypothetical protein